MSVTDFHFEILSATGLKWQPSRVAIILAINIYSIPVCRRQMLSNIVGMRTIQSSFSTLCCHSTTHSPVIYYCVKCERFVVNTTWCRPWYDSDHHRLEEIQHFNSRKQTSHLGCVVVPWIGIYLILAFYTTTREARWALSRGLQAIIRGYQHDYQ